MPLELDVSQALSLGEGQTLTVRWDSQGATREGFILRYEGRLYAYRNECPHWSVELDLGDGHFFDESLGRIYCKNHGALFRPVDGLCETGPCLGRALVPLSLRESEGRLYLGERVGAGTPE